MCLKSGMLTARNAPLMASSPLVIIVKGQDTLQLTADPYIEVFNHLKEAYVDQWVKKGEELVQSIWRMKTIENLLWETKQGYIKEWRRGILVATTTGHYNLVVC